MKANAKTHALSSFGSGAAGLLLLLLVIGAVVVTLGNLRLRRDFTEDKLYTLSDGSRRLLAGLPEDVTLKFFFNRSSPAVPMFVKSYARQVEDLLKEYELAAQGRIVVETSDPRSDSAEEEWAQRYGIQPQPTGVMTPPIYFGIVAVSGEREETLPALAPQGEATLEYDLSRLVSRAATAVRPVIGVLSDLPVMGAPPMQPMMRQAAPQPWYAIQELQRDFDVRTVNRDLAAIEPAITTLLVIHPKHLPPRTLYAIDQFVMRGGRLVACVDPLSLADLKATLATFAREMMGPKVGVRFRPHFFPFTEPSVEVDFSCHLCGGRGCRVCKQSGWIEIAGAGMVDPRVYEHVNRARGDQAYDPASVYGYAFGFGVERIAMVKYGIPDIRWLYENDTRFLSLLA